MCVWVFASGGSSDLISYGVGRMYTHLKAREKLIVKRHKSFVWKCSYIL
jgi:hypothetical protein